MSQAPGTPTDQDEFESAFSALAAGNEPAAPQAASEGEPASEGSTPGSPSEGQAQPPASAEPAAAAAEPPTGEDLRAKLIEAEQRARSSEGRLSAFSRQAQDAEARALAAERALAELNARAPAPAPAPAAGVEGDDDDILQSSPELRASIERRVAKALAPLQQALDAANARLTQLDDVAKTAVRQVEPLVARQAEQELDATRRRLDAEFPAWRDTVKSGDFKAWLDRQPQQVQQLYQNGASFNEAAVVLRLFRAETPQGSGAPAPAAQPAAASNVINPERVRAAAGIRVSTPPRPAAVPEDFEGAFAAFASQRAARR